MPRVVSFIVLLAIILLIGSVFFQVMAQFLVPLFLAAVMVVIFNPLHRWICRRMPDRPRLAALLSTVAIVLIVLLPISGMLIRAVAEGADLYRSFSDEETTVVVEEDTAVVTVRETPVEQGAEAGDLAEQDDPDDESESVAIFIEELVERVNPMLVRFRLPLLDPAKVQPYVEEKFRTAAAPLALGGMRILGSTLVGLAIMILSIYYFFADGPAMITALMKMSPLDDQYEQELLDKFSDISRAVVVATLLSAIVQGLLAGMGYWVVGIERVFFLTSLTVFLAMVPFVGAAAVWLPVSLWLVFYTGDPAYPEGRLFAGVALAIYGGTVVSMVDNLIKPLILHGQSNLHPLLALLSVIGGVQVLGPIGILVGPMLVAFLQALLNMLNKELHQLGNESAELGKSVEFATGVSASNSASAPPPVPKPVASKKPEAAKKKKGKKG